MEHDVKTIYRDTRRGVEILTGSIDHDSGISYRINGPNRRRGSNTAFVNPGAVPYLRIKFQEGSLEENGFNGVTESEVLEILIHRLTEKHASSTVTDMLRCVVNYLND